MINPDGLDCWLLNLGIALLEYLIKQKPKYAEDYERLKAGLTARFNRRTGVNSANELYNKTKGTGTVGTLETQMVALARQSFPELEE